MIDSELVQNYIKPVEQLSSIQVFNYQVVGVVALKYLE